MPAESLPGRLAQKAADLCDRILLSRWLWSYVLLAGALVTLPNLGRESLWLDELFSAYSSFTPLSVKELFAEHVLMDVHPPLYPVILYFWGKVVGQSEFIARLPSYLALSAGLIGSYALLRPVLPRRVAALYLVIISFTPGVIYYAQEMRPYGLLLGVSAVLSALYVRFRRSITTDAPISRGLLWLYTVSALLAVYTHLYANLLLAALALPLLEQAQKRHARSNLRRLLCAHLVVATLSALWLFVHFRYGTLTAKMGGNFWIREADLGSHLGRFLRLLVGNPWGGLAYATLALALFVLSRPRAVFRDSWPLIAPVLLVFVAALATSFHTPTITARNLIVTLPLLALVVAHAANAAYAYAGGCVALFLMLLTAAGTVHSFSYRKTGWREAAMYVRRNFSPKSCAVPVRDLVDPDHGQNFAIYPRYYLGDTFRFTTTGPTVQPECDLILYDAHVTDKQGVEALLSKYGIHAPHQILEFHGAYVVVRRHGEERGATTHVAAAGG